MYSSLEHRLQNYNDDGGEPKFDFSSWNPEPPASLQYLSLLAVGSNTEEDYPQTDHVKKLMVSHLRREKRRRAFAHGFEKSLVKDMKEEKKLRNAAGSGDSSLVKELLDQGVDPGSQDKKKRCALHIAAASGNSDIVRLLLERGADPNQTDVVGNTPLHLAACTSRIPVITLLLQAGTDVNALDNLGRSPLHLAKARLRHLHQDKHCTAESMKSEVFDIARMAKEYMCRVGQEEDARELDQLCDKLSNTSTRPQVDQIGELLADFASLHIRKNDQSS